LSQNQYLFCEIGGSRFLENLFLEQKKIKKNFVKNQKTGSPNLAKKALILAGGK